MNQSDIQSRLYRAILIAGAILSVACIIGNCISDFPPRSNIKWMVLFIMAVVAFFVSRYKKYAEPMMFGVFLFLVCIFLPFAFVDSGGSNNNATGYTFLLLIAITYLFKGWKRYFLVAALIAAFMAMHALEYFRPELIAVYTGWNQFIDRMIQIPLILTASFFIILQFAREYERINAKLLLYANLDELTGLYNRRVFDRAMEEAVNNSRELAYLVLIDLDNFKKINDKYGHHMGDEVLKELSTLLRQSFDQKRHVVSRWGGDEFAIIYYGEKGELAKKLEEIQRAFKDYVSVYEETTGISTSTALCSDFDKVSQALAAADGQLYKEKRKKCIR